MDFAALPPEVNSGLMYTGPGAGPMLAAGSAWNALGAELGMVGTAYGSVITELTSGPWLGPSAIAMVSAAMPFVTWLGTTAGFAEQTGMEAFAAAAAYEAAFAATVPPPVIAANRSLLMMLIATNFLGINTAAIAATEAAYMEMWAQDATAMIAYSASATAATAALTPFTPAPVIVNPAAVGTQGAVDAQVTGNAVAGNAQSAVSNAVSGLPTAGSGAGTNPLSTLLNGLLGNSSSSSSSIPGLGGSLLQNYATLPGWFGIETGSSVLGALFNPAISNAMTPAAAAADAAAGTAAADGAAAADLGGAAAADIGGAAAADLGGMAGSVGGLSVPATWGFSAAGLPSALGSVSLAVPAAGADVGAGLGFPFMFPPGAMGAAGRTATAGVAGGLAGAVAARFLPRMRVTDGKPEPVVAGTSALPPIRHQIPVPAGLPSNGDTPPGYQMVISYMPVEKTDA